MPKLRIAAIMGSPRPKGATRKMLDVFIEQAGSLGADVEVITPSRLKVAACIHCDACIGRGSCIIEDDAAAAFETITSSDLLLSVAPVYFGGVPGDFKCLIDRAQVYWNMRYISREKSDFSLRRGVVLSICGSRRDDMFDGIHQTMKYFYDALGLKYDPECDFLGYRKIEGPRDFSGECIEEIRAFAKGVVASMRKEN